MEQLIREGKISYVGSSNFAGWDIATAQCKADARNLLGLASEQSLYNLTQRTIELEVIPALRHYGIGLIPEPGRDGDAGRCSEENCRWPPGITAVAGTNQPPAATTGGPGNTV